MTYKIIRMFQRDVPSQIIKRGLTLEEAKAHCKSKETSSATCTERSGRRLLETFGPWFDGYEEEKS